MEKSRESENCIGAHPDFWLHPHVTAADRALRQRRNISTWAAHLIRQHHEICSSWLVCASCTINKIRLCCLFANFVHNDCAHSSGLDAFLFCTDMVWNLQHLPCRARIINLFTFTKTCSSSGYSWWEVYLGFVWYVFVLVFVFAVLRYVFALHVVHARM